MNPTLQAALHYLVIIAVIAFAAVELAIGKLDTSTAVAIVAAAGGFSIGVGSQTSSIGASH